MIKNKIKKIDKYYLHTKFFNNYNLIIGLSFLCFIILIAIFAPIISPYDPTTVNLNNRLLPPLYYAENNFHMLGTDSLGRDILSRIIYGARISLLVGIISAFGAGIVGVIIGAVAGFFGRWVDELIMRIVDIGLSIPFLLLAMAVSMLLGSGLLNVVIILSITGWMQIARVTRGAALKEKEEIYIEAAYAYGSSPFRTLFKHLIPNLIAPIIVIISQQFGIMIYSESTLSFLGLGVPVEIPTWGKMIADGQNYIATAWWITVFPGIILTLTVIAAFLLGDGLRDFLDPKINSK